MRPETREQSSLENYSARLLNHSDNLICAVARLRLPGGRPRCNAYYCSRMTNPVASNPQNVCHAIWIAWGLSWWLAAVWSSRVASRASVADELPYRLLTT